MLILLVAGLMSLAGCETVKTAADAATLLQVGKSNCPPVIPRLPGVSEEGLVILMPVDQASLLIYFKQVERCLAQSTGL